MAPSRREEELLRLGLFSIFVAALVAAGLGAGIAMAEAALGGLGGYIIAVLLDLLWRDRTRPKSTPLWVLLGIAWGAYILFSATFQPLELVVLFVALPLSLAIALFFRHDHGMTPTLFLAGSVWMAIFWPGRGIDASLELEESAATWVALAVLLGIIAATLEHDRLSRRTGGGTPIPWTIIRFGFVAVWTILVLALRESIQWAQIFAALGANMQGQSGQMFLIGVIVVALVVTAIAFRPPGQKRDRGPVRPR